MKELERPPKRTRDAFRNPYRCPEKEHRWMTVGIGGTAEKRHVLDQECRNRSAHRTVVSVKQEDGSWAESARKIARAALAVPQEGELCATCGGTGKVGNIAFHPDELLDERDDCPSCSAQEGKPR